MSDIKWNERLIARAISTQILRRKCIVMLENTSWTGSECDILGLTTDLRVIDIEVKISRSDLKADAKKDKWWQPLTWKETTQIPKLVKNDFFYEKVAKKMPDKVWKHYYAMPAEIWSDDLLDFLPSTYSGILLLKKLKPPHREFHVTVHRQAKPNRNAERVSAEQAIDIARLANIRMWNAIQELEVNRRVA